MGCLGKSGGVLLTAIAATLAGGCDGRGADAAPTAALPQCPLGAAVETDGVRRLALVVGVGEYRAPAVPDLAGPPGDARRFVELLTGRGGYGFPRQNVCVLTDEQATVAGFREHFQKALVERARPQDVAVIFYAGHGSMRRDRNGDEPDEMDETFVLHDSRTPGVADLADDEFNEMLTRLHARTRHITVVLDSCNSGTATRGADGTFTARYFRPADDDPGDAGVQPAQPGEDRKSVV